MRRLGKECPFCLFPTSLTWCWRGESRKADQGVCLVRSCVSLCLFPRDCISWTYERGKYGACSVFLLDYVFSMNPFLGEGEGGVKGWLAGVLSCFFAFSLPALGRRWRRGMERPFFWLFVACFSWLFEEEGSKALVLGGESGRGDGRRERRKGMRGRDWESS